MTEKKNAVGAGLIGRIRISQKGAGFVRLEDAKAEDVEIEHDSLNTALNGDIVRIKITGKTRWKTPKGSVLEVIKRAKRGFSGTLLKKDGEFILKPSDPKMYTEIIIPKNDTSGAQPGDKVFTEITKWTIPSKPPLGKVVKVLGKAGENNAEMEGIILERGFETGFPVAIERAAEKLKSNKPTEEDISSRKDFRKTTTFTIDPADAKDFDDALSFKKLDNGNFEIGIHIADVSYYVTPNSELDKEAYERATSVYLVDRTIPMLPEVLSNDLCSLNPNEDKFTFGAVFEMDASGKVLNQWFGRTIIHSDKRFSYEEAQGVLDAGSGMFYEELHTLNTIAKKLTKKRIAEGAITMETDEVKFKLDATGKPVAVYIKTRGDTNKLIEEFMLLANREVAFYGAKDDSKKDRLFLYRIHDEPNEEKIEDLKKYVKLLGYDLGKENLPVKPEQLNRLLEELEGSNEKNTVSTAIIRSMQKAVYSTKNLGHYGLAFKFYSHFTSPIRRYPDVICHRMLQSYLSGEIIPNEAREKYEKMAIHCTEREIEASEAERSSIKYKQIEYMSERIGEEFIGIISGMTERGIFVAEKSTRAEGMIKIRDLAGDSYAYNSEKLTLIGTNSGKLLRVGDEIKIRVKAVDIDKQLLDYEMLE